MIYQNPKPYYSVDLIYRIGDKVALVSMVPGRAVKPQIFTIVHVERPQKDFGLHDQILTLQCVKTGKTSKFTGEEVLKYDTFLIFWVMAFYNRMLAIHFNNEADIF